MSYQITRYLGSQKVETSSQPDLLEDTDEIIAFSLSSVLYHSKLAPSAPTSYSIRNEPQIDFILTFRIKRQLLGSILKYLVNFFEFGLLRLELKCQQ